jgi:hypothetical protein
MKDIFSDSIREDRTSIFPLRWFANLCGEIAGWSILKAAYLDEDEDYGIKYKIHGKIYSLTWPVYNKFGTFYKIDFDMSGKEWDDYDENGHPYWLYTEWQEDPETGDAWRLVRK